MRMETKLVILGALWRISLVWMWQLISSEDIYFSLDRRSRVPQIYRVSSSDEKLASLQIIRA